MQHEKGKLEEAFIMHERCYEMRQTLHGKQCTHSDIAASLYNLGRLYHEKRKLEEAVNMHERCCEMRQTIHGEECAYPDIGESFSFWS